MAVTVEMRTQVSQLYVALFGRAPDAEGLAFWTQMLAGGASVADVANTMYATDPARSYYPLFLTNQEIIASFYQNVLGRPADAEGLAFWTAKLNAPGATPGAVIQEMIDVVVNYTGTDPDGLVSAALFANKVEVAQAYGEAGGGVAGASAILVGVTDDPATVAAKLAQISGPAIGDTLQLTALTDNITIAQPNTADTVQGIVDGNPGNGDSSTLTALDKIVGNGFTKVELAVVEAGTAAPATTFQNIETLELIAGTGGGITFNAALWENIGDIQLNSGSNGLQAIFTNLHAGVDLSVGAGVTGTLGASYTDSHGAGVYSEKGASISYMDGGDISGTAGAGKVVGVGVVALADGVDLTVGDVTLAGSAGASAYVYVQNTRDVGGDIAVGDVAIDGFDYIGLFVDNTDHTAMSPAGNVTIGDVTLAVDMSGSILASVSNWSDGVVGNTTIGNVSLTAADKVTSAWFYQYQRGGLGAGDVTVGDVSLMVGASASGSIYLENYAGWDSATGAPIALGDMSVGDVSIDVGFGGSAYFSVSAEACTTAAGRSASVGSYTVGDMAVTLAQDAWLSMDFDQEAIVYGLGASASVGDVSIGALDATLAVGASLSYSVSVSAYSSSGPGASVGNVAIGPVMLDMGINSDADISYSVYASGMATSQVHVGDVSVGGMSALLDDGAHLDYSVEITSYGDIGDVNLGDIGVQAGVSATAHMSVEVSASTDIASLELGDVNVSAGLSSSITLDFSATASSGSIGDVRFGNLTAVAAQGADITLYHEVSASLNLGNVTIGDVSLSAAAPGAYVYVSHDFSAWTGAIGNVNVGDVSVAAATSAYAYYDFYMNGETAIGNVSIGDVSVSAVGKSASASAYFDIKNDGVGTIGNITVGDVDVTVNGESAWGGFYISAFSATSAGTVTVGDLDLSVGTVAQVTAQLDVAIGNALGSVVVGDIDLTGTSVRTGTADIMDYTADVSIWSAGDITIGTISVSGGDGTADNFAGGTLFDLATGGGWLSLSAAQDVILGGVDYSGYGSTAGLTLDVSGFKGNTTVVGSAGNDTLVDNAGDNELTGGAGADTFTILDTNTGTTLGLIDKIMDFSNAGGDKIDLIGLTGTVNVTNYGEAGYADFSAFLAGADAADKAVWVGLIGSDGFAAVDHDGGGVDYVIQLVGLGSLGNIDVASFA